MTLKEYKMLLGKYSLLSTKYNIFSNGHWIPYLDWIEDDEISLSCKELEKENSSNFN